jgi:hypothetical protein
MKLAVAVSIALFAAPAAFAHSLPRCAPTMRSGTACRIAVRDVHPTQLTFGAQEVDERAGKIRRMDRDELADYLHDHVAPIAYGPGGRAYLTDRHHLALALADARGDASELEAEVAANWRDLDADDFWAAMDGAGYLWLLDACGQGPHPVSDLPASVHGLVDDPLRSLAWLVREEGGYDDTDAMHAEFLWTEFFRAHLDPADVEADWDRAVRDGVRLARSRAASDLPGWHG